MVINWLRAWAKQLKKGSRQQQRKQPHRSNGERSPSCQRQAKGQGADTVWHGKNSRPVGPGDQRVRVNLGGGVARLQRHVLAQIKIPAQFRHGRLPGANLLRAGALQQPPGQRRPSALGLSGIQQFENRAGAEQIEVNGIRMMRVEELVMEIEGGSCLGDR